MSTDNTTSESLMDIQSKNENIMNNIEKLTEVQDELKYKLEEGIATGMSEEERTKLTTNITDISGLIQDLYSTVSNTYTFVQNSIASNAKTMESQAYATNIVNSELTVSNDQVEDKDTEKANKMKLIEINDYYSEEYLDRTNMMKSVILVCIPLIILTVLKNKGVLSDNIFKILIILIIVIGFIYLFKLFLKIISHNNMQYQKYDWNFNKSAAPPVDTSNPEGGGSDVGATSTTCTTTPV